MISQKSEVILLCSSLYTNTLQKQAHQPIRSFLLFKNLYVVYKFEKSIVLKQIQVFWISEFLAHVVNKYNSKIEAEYF